MDQRLRFSFKIGFCAALAVTVTGLLISWRIHREELNAFRRESALLADAIASSLLLSQDPADHSAQAKNQDLLAEIVRMCPRVYHIALIDKYGKVETQTEVPDSETDLLAGQWREEVSVQEVLASEKTFLFPGRWEGYYSLRLPDGLYWGKLRIVWRHDRISELLNELFVLIASSAVGMGLIGLMVGRLLYRTTPSARADEMSDRLRHIINSDFSGRVNAARLPGTLADVGEQVNRLLDGIDQQRKRMIVLEESLRQTESSYRELQAESSHQAEISQREHEMALYAFQQLFENISDGAILTDDGASILAVNGVADRWMHLAGQEGPQLSDDVLVRLIRRVVENAELDRDTSAWEVPDPLRGGRSPGRATAVVIRREDRGPVYVLMLLRTEEARLRRDWLAPLSERFLFGELLPWLSKLLSEPRYLPGLSDEKDTLDRHVDVLARLSTLRQIGRIGPEDFHSLSVGSWLSRHLQAADLFSNLVGIRFHPPRAECTVWTVESVLGEALDLLIEILLDAAGQSGCESPIDLFVDKTRAGGVVLRFELPFRLSARSRRVLKAVGSDQISSLGWSEEIDQQKWTFTEHVRIVGAAFLRSLLGCRLDLRQGEVSPLCARWSFPPGSEYGPPGRAPSFTAPEVRVNQLIRDYLARSREDGNSSSLATGKHPSSSFPLR